MNSSQNIIHSSSLNFEYENRASASRCAILIESIFNTQILPELEKAISSSIPDWMMIELSKLEINIGKISEKEITSNLANRIGESIADTLKNSIRNNMNQSSGYKPFGRQMSGDYLIDSIEVFLLKGYFPIGLDHSVELNDLVKKAIEQNKKEFIAILEKYRNYEPAIRRISYNLNTETFDLVLFALIPLSSNLIIDFRKILSLANQQRAQGQITENEFLQSIHYFILNYILNESGLVFDKKKFSTTILKEFMLLNSDFHFLIQTLKRYTGKTTAIILMNETLGELMTEKTQALSEVDFPGLNIFRLIELLNSSGIESKSYKSQFLKDEIIQAINAPEKRKLLIEQLNKTAVRLILELFYSNDSKSLFRLIVSFTENSASQSFLAISDKGRLSVNQLVLNTVIYLNENSIRKLDKEEFVLFLIYSAGLDTAKIAKSDSFAGFIRAQKNLDFEKIISLIGDEQLHPEISRIPKLISKSQNQEKTKENNLYPEEYFSIYSKKIIGYYLDSGQLPGAYYELSWKDVQALFRDLILFKDDFLVSQFRMNKNPESLIQRINLLAVSISYDDLKEYLIHFFSDEYKILSEIIAKITLQSSFKTDSHIQSKVFEVELLITSLAKSQGGSLSGVFIFSVIEQLNNELAKDSTDSEKLLQFLFSKSDDIPEIVAFKNKLSSNSELKSAIDRELKLLVSKLHFTEFGRLQHSENIQELIKNLAFYYQIDQKLFLELLLKNSENIFQVYTLFKFYLPQDQWNLIEKSWESTSELKKELKLFRKDSDIEFRNIKQPECNLSQTFNSYSLSEPQKLKTFLFLIISNEAMFEKFVSQTEVDRLPSNLKFGDQKLTTYLQQLMSFYPESIAARIDRKFWKSTVLSFGILISLEDKKFDSGSFAKAFRNHLLQKLKSMNEAELFYPILDNLNSSGSNELKELVEFRHIPKEGKSSKTSANKSDNPDSAKEIYRHFSILRFYVQNGFFPWWAGNLTFPELIFALNSSSQLSSKIFEEAFLRFEKEEHLFERLVAKIPDHVVSELNQLISNHSPLNEIWEKILLKHKKRGNEEVGNAHEQKEIDLIFKKLYSSGDEEVLNNWQNHNRQIAVQIREYLHLSPYFNFQAINSSQWRQAIYQFSLDFYEHEKMEVSDQFHSEFLKYLKSHYSNINWTITLATVYKRTQSSFPKGLIDLINSTPGSQTKDNEIGNELTNIRSTDDEGIVVKISNAGLILFWPFLTRLFEHLSLVKNGAFINHECQNRAVYILQYLVYNTIDFPEYKLVLNKLLVGMQSQDHLVPFITLTDDEKDSAQSLLKGLINNWEKVKNSTPEGIQETFLKREGILRFKTDKVTLEVEKKGVDILLESIPWNISLIKLAWMKVPIYVEWI